MPDKYATKSASNSAPHLPMPLTQGDSFCFPRAGDEYVGRSNVMPIFVTIKMACKMLSQGRTSIHKLINEGKLERVKVGRSSLITMRSILAFSASLTGRGDA